MKVTPVNPVYMMSDRMRKYRFNVYATDIRTHQKPFRKKLLDILV